MMNRWGARKSLPERDLEGWHKRGRKKTTVGFFGDLPWIVFHPSQTPV